MTKLILLFIVTGLAGCSNVEVPVTPSEACSQITDAAARSSCDADVALARAKSQRGDFPATAFGIGWFSLFWYLAHYLVGLVFGRFVYVDAKRREWLAFRVKPLWWGALCVFEPALGALVYWVLHYSRLARRGHAGAGS